MGAICGVRCVGMATASSPYTRTAGLPPPTSLAVHRGVSDTRATIGVRGLPARLTVLHVTDSHVDAGPEPGREAEAEFMLSVNSQGLPDVSAGGAFTSAAAKLRSQLGKGRQEGAQLVAHTGDLVNFPSPKAVAHVQALVAEAGIPFLYVAGNHDWAYSAGGGSGRLAGSVGPWVPQGVPRSAAVPQLGVLAAGRGESHALRRSGRQRRVPPARRRHDSKNEYWRRWRCRHPTTTPPRSAGGAWGCVCSLRRRHASCEEYTCLCF